MGGWNIQTHHHTSLIPIQTHFIQTQCIASLPMNTFKNKYRIASARAPFWDYGWNAAYFVTICTQNRECWFGEISDGKMDLSPIRSEEHTSELQSRGHLVCRLLLEKRKPL